MELRGYYNIGYAWRNCIIGLMICAALGNVTNGGATTEVLLTGNVNNSVFYDTQTVIFTCTIRDNGKGPIVLAWKSENYVGLGGDVLEVVSIDNPGTTEYSSTHPTTVATLISTTVNNDTAVTEVVSELRIIASIQYPNSSVSCQLDNHGTPVTFEFRVTQPIILLTSNLTEQMVAYDNQTIIFTCVIQGSGIILLSWISDDYIGPSDVIEFASVDVPERIPPRASTLDPTTVATLISTTTNNNTGVTEIESELRITASAQYPISFVGCRNDGHGAINSTTFETLNATASTQLISTATVTTSDKTSFPSDTATSTITTKPRQETGQTRSYIVAAVIVVSILAALIILVILLLYDIARRKKRPSSPYHCESVTGHQAEDGCELTNINVVGDGQSFHSGRDLDLETNASGSSIPPTGEQQ